MRGDINSPFPVLYFAPRPHEVAAPHLAGFALGTLEDDAIVAAAVRRQGGEGRRWRRRRWWRELEQEVGVVDEHLVLSRRGRTRGRSEECYC